MACSFFILRGVDWNGENIISEKSDTEFLFVRGKEIIDDNIYIRTQTGRSGDKIPRCCWWCIDILKEVKDPETQEHIYLPLQYFPMKKVYSKEGAFCSKQCAKAYCIDNIPKNPIVYNRALALLESMNREEGGKAIVAAPSWKLLQSFFGPLTMNQFKSESGVVSMDPNPSIRMKNSLPTSSYFREN